MGDLLKEPLAYKVNSSYDLHRSYCEWTTVELSIDQMVMVAFVVMVVRVCT
jgi:hypothetical protein